MKTIKCNVKKSIAIILSGVALLAICFFFAFCNFRQYVDVSLFNNDIVYYLIKAFMVFAFVFLGFGILVILRSVLLYKNKMIEIGDDYLLDKFSFACGGEVRYTEIKSTYIKGMFLCIKLHNEEQFLKKQNFLKQLLMRANKKMGYEYITISDNFLDTNLFEIKKLINEKITY
ncbi:MAG: hypothetical protein IKT32_07840 [Clostridia bacterium]|nr:hypothetical protein [Clostridia bacterium]